MSTASADSTSNPPAAASSVGPIRHVVLVRFKRNLPQLQIEGVAAHFKMLPKKIDSIVSAESGSNISRERMNDRYTHCFTVTFADEAARDAFVEHPSRAAFMSVLRPKADRFILFDYANGD